MDIPAGIGCKKGLYAEGGICMNTAFIEPKTDESVNAKEKECVAYEHAGYTVRVHFSGNKTLVQCMKNLTEKRIAG